MCRLSFESKAAETPIPVRVLRGVFVQVTVEEALDGWIIGVNP